MVWTDEDLLFTGLKGGLRLGHGDDMSHVIRLNRKAQMGLDITELYISPSLIRVWLSGTNQGIQRTKSYPRNSMGRYWAVEVPINAPSKGVSLLTVHSAVIIF